MTLFGWQTQPKYPRYFFFLFLIAFLCEINAIEVLGRELKTSAQLQGGREEGITKVNQKRKGGIMVGDIFLCDFCFDRFPFCFSFVFVPNFVFCSLGRQQTVWDVIGIDERESAEFILIDGSDNFVVNGCQDGIFLGEFTVEIQGVSSAFLQVANTRFESEKWKEIKLDVKMEKKDG
jgi:hypothetical protein